MLPDRIAQAAAVACGRKFPVWGGDGERQDPPESGQQNEDVDKDEDAGQDKDADQDKDVDGDADPGDGEPGDKSDKKPSLEEQLDQLKRDNITLKKSNEQLKANKKKAESDKDAAKERDEVVAERDELKSLLDGKFLSWSIQTFADGKTKYDWVDIEDVVNAINREAIDIDLKTGEVKGLDLELKRIAKKKPHWLKKDEDEDDDSTDRNPSGFHPHGGKMKQSDLDKQKVGEKYRIPGYGSQALRPV